MLYLIYYTYRNLIYYRVEREIDRRRLIEMKSAITDNDIKYALTNCCLATVGLKIADNKKDLIPWYIPLSKVQKSWVKQVSEFGYKCGLT